MSDDKLQLHLVIETTDKKDLQVILGLLGEYTIESATWQPVRPNGPVYRTPQQKGGDDRFVEAARGVVATPVVDG